MPQRSVCLARSSWPAPMFWAVMAEMEEKKEMGPIMQKSLIRPEAPTAADSARPMLLTVEPMMRKERLTSTF